MKHDIFKADKQVHDEKSFLAFLRLLGEDFSDELKRERTCPSSPFGSGANGWENGSIDSFLEAATAWAESHECKETCQADPENVWKRCAQILHAGKFYE